MTANSEPFWIRMPRILIGTGAVENVGELAKKFGGRKVLIVTDPGVVQAGLVDKVKQPLEKEGIEFGIFDGCEPDVPIHIVKKCAQFAKDGGYDFMISVGGGSTLDTGKVASIVATAEDIAQEDISQYIAKGAPRHGLPRIHIPTTSGSGADVSLGSPVTDVDGAKKVVFGEYLLPEVAIIDPLMTLNLPAKITADTGIDALCHAIEGYTSIKANVVSDMLSETVIRLVADNLRLAYCKGSKNLEARYNMAIAASLAIHCVLTSSAVLPHGMGHSLQSEVKCTHAVSCSIMLPHVMEFNLLVDQPKYTRMAELMGERVEGLSLQDAARKAVEAVRKLTIDLGIPQRLRDIGMKKEQIPRVVDILFTPVNVWRVNNNPRDCSREDAARIFEAAW